MVFALFHVQCVMHSFVRGVFLNWSGLSIGKKRKKAWKVAPLCIFWSIRESVDQTIKLFLVFILGLG